MYDFGYMNWTELVQVLSWVFVLTVLNVEFFIPVTTEFVIQSVTNESN